MAHVAVQLSFAATIRIGAINYDSRGASTLCVIAPDKTLIKAWCSIAFVNRGGTIFAPETSELGTRNVFEDVSGFRMPFSHISRVRKLGHNT